MGTDKDFQRLNIGLSEVEKQTERRQQIRQRIRLLKMAGIVLGLLLFITVIAIVVVGQKAKARDPACFDGLECLPLAACEAYPNQDFVYQCGDDEPVSVCCIPKYINSSRMEKLALLPKKCGIAPIGSKISNGVNASIGEFPWMALLGFTTPARNIPEYMCGGTIINNRYILTAAHCTSHNMFNLTTVTLGELNLATPIDCEFDGVSQDCADEPVHINIERIIPHPLFNKQNLRNDIALLRLQHTIDKFTDFIQPICLPVDIKTSAGNMSTKNFTISGWGKTTTSEVGVTLVLQRARLRTVEPDTCDPMLPEKVRPLGRHQFCASGTEPNQEACQGDSGGPLTILNTTNVVNYQVGIVSYKPQENCGVEPQPTVFTRVDSYIGWILDNLQP